MRRVYTSVANFRAPYNNVEFAGLGDAPTWPKGRTYWDTANFMATQDDGYFQNNSLFGLGATDPAARPALLSYAGRVSSSPSQAAIEASRRASSEAASRAGAIAAQAEAVARGLIPPPASKMSYLIPAAVGAAIIGAAVFYYLKK